MFLSYEDFLLYILLYYMIIQIQVSFNDLKNYILFNEFSIITILYLAILIYAFYFDSYFYD